MKVKRDGSLSSSANSFNQLNSTQKSFTKYYCNKVLHSPGRQSWASWVGWPYKAKDLLLPPSWRSAFSLLADDGFTKNPNLHQDTQYLISVPKIKFSMQSIHRGVKMYDAKL